MISMLLMSCREVYKRVCVAGGDPKLVEFPTEPKWSAQGMYISFWNDKELVISFWRRPRLQEVDLLKKAIDY